MTKKIAAKQVDKQVCFNYLKKAEENIRSAQKAYEAGDFNAAGVSAVHAAISAADAYCVYALSKRCSSPKHEDAAVLIDSAPFPDSEKTFVSKKFSSIVRMKNMAEYEERLVKPKEAEKAVKEAAELVDAVKQRLCV